jgi:hypothetical protein
MITTKMEIILSTITGKSTEITTEETNRALTETTTLNIVSSSTKSTVIMTADTTTTEAKAACEMPTEESIVEEGNQLLRYIKVCR